jgi:hypothetical protein
MSIVAVVTYTPNAEAVLVRSYYGNLGFRWQPSMTILATGNPFVIRENVFGGYVTTIKLKPQFYEWSSNTYTLGWVFEDFYVTAPGGGAPIPGVGLALETGFSANGVPAIAGEWAGAAGDVLLFPMPVAPLDYWLQLPT